MSSNPYEDPAFARDYVVAEADMSRNRYEWQVTHPALLQFLQPDVSKAIDYGCGSGIFTAAMSRAGRSQLNPDMKFVGTDASAEMSRYTRVIGTHAVGCDFEQWDAQHDDIPPSIRSTDRIFAKLVFNYISSENLATKVLPKLRACLTDTGLLVAVLANPLREVGYDLSANQTTKELATQVGSFGEQAGTTVFHHTYEQVVEAADTAGFAVGGVYGLPAVRFSPYRRQPWSTPRLMKIADPQPMLPYTNNAKRWLYVFGATDKAKEAFEETTQRFIAWRRLQFPEIADAAHIRIPAAPTNANDVLPLENPNRSVLYQYNGPDGSVSIVDGTVAENLSPSDKVRLAKKLAAAGVREAFRIQDSLII